LKSAADYCQTQRQIQQDALGSARIARVAQQCLYENCPQINSDHPINSPNLNIVYISCMGKETRSFFETFIQRPKQFLNSKLQWRRHGTLFHSPINKAVPSCINYWWSTWRMTEDILSIFLYSKVFTLPLFALS